MHPQLEVLLEIQDLKSQRADFLEQGDGSNFEQEFFKISVGDAVAQLDEKIAEMEESMDPRVRSRYQRLSGSRAKFIVPVINGTCFGCFVSIPTAVATSPERHSGLHHCDNCGRFLYLID